MKTMYQMTHEDILICEECYVRVAEHMDEQQLVRYDINPLGWDISGFTEPLDGTMLHAHTEGYLCSVCVKGTNHAIPAFPEDLDGWTWVLSYDGGQHYLWPNHILEIALSEGQEHLKELDG